MNGQQTPPSMLANHEQLSYAHLHGRWFMLVRTACTVLNGLAFLLFVAALPAYVAALHVFCTGDGCSFGQLTPSNAPALRALGLSINSYADFVLLLMGIPTLLCFAVAALLVFRKPDIWMAQLVAFLLAMIGASNLTTDRLVMSPVLGSVGASLVTSFFN